MAADKHVVFMRFIQRSLILKYIQLQNCLGQMACKYDNPHNIIFYMHVGVLLNLVRCAFLESCI